MNINIKTLTKYNACNEAQEWFINSKCKTIEEGYKKLKEEKHLNKYHWTNWIISRLLNKNDKIKYAIFAAELVIDIFEKEYPNDKRPRKAIEAAKKYLKNKTSKNKSAAYTAADAAVDAAADAAADAAYNATHAAYAAAYAAADAAYAAAAVYAAYNADAYTADAAYTAAHAAYNAADAVYNKVLSYGIKLLNKK
jgi:hypothetical protein